MLNRRLGPVRNSGLSKAVARRLSRHDPTTDRDVLEGTLVSLRSDDSERASRLSGALRCRDHSSSVLVRFLAFDTPTPSIGCWIQFAGTWEEDCVQGVYFRALGLTGSSDPQDAESLVRYLVANVPSVGVMRAQRLVAELGMLVLDSLASDPTLPRRIWPGKVGISVTNGVKLWLRETRNEEWCRSTAVKIMAASAGSYKQARRICDYYGSASVAEHVLNDDPYQLLEVPGLGWKSVDNIGRALGLDDDDPRRLKSLVLATVENLYSRGHTAISREQLHRRLEAIATVPRKAVSRAIAELVLSAELVRTQRCLSLPQVIRDERALSRFTIKHNRRAELPAEQRAIITRMLSSGRLNVDQREAVLMALEAKVSIIIGAAGTGKSTTIRGLISAAHLLHWQVQLLTPTGKAATKLSEVTGQDCQTIHRYLAPRGGARKPTEDDRPLLVIVDEASMVDLTLAARLVENLGEYKELRLVLVGDPNQLPSVGPGQVLRDFIVSGIVPTASLSITLRQKSGSAVLEHATRLLEGQGLDLQETWDFRVVELPAAPDKASGAVRRALQRVIDEERTSASRRLDNNPFRPTIHLQVLTPRNGGPLGVEGLNPMVRAVLNPRRKVGPSIGGGEQVSRGDRVMCMENAYNVGDHGIFNGEVGTVEDFDRDSILVRMSDSRLVRFSGAERSLLSLAYAITVHKSQGSEYEIVVLVVHKSHGGLVDQGVLYTAFTRPTRRLVLCADHSTLADLAAGRLGRLERHTGLASRIFDAMSA